MFDRRLTINASVYYEDWRHIQLEAYPDDWALNINGNSVSIYGADIDVLAGLGASFSSKSRPATSTNGWTERPHSVIAPIGKMPDVAPVSGTLALQLFQAARRLLYVHGSIGEFIHRSSLLYFLLRPLRIHRDVQTIARI